MKKSPLSTPSSSRGKQCYNWKLCDHKSRTGYTYGNDDSYQCVSSIGVQMRTGNDFIPLNVSTPVSEKKRHSGNWYGSGGGRNHRNSGSGGFNQYRNNYHATSKSNYNNSYSPYKHSGKQFHGQKKVILNRTYISLCLQVQKFFPLSAIEHIFFTFRVIRRMRTNRLTYQTI